MSAPGIGPRVLDAMAENGQRAVFGLYETQYAANRAARRFAAQGFSVSQSARSPLFINYIGGSVASALVNLAQVFV